MKDIFKIHHVECAMTEIRFSVLMDSCYIDKIKIRLPDGDFPVMIWANGMYCGTVRLDCFESDCNLIHFRGVYNSEFINKNVFTQKFIERLHDFLD